jgi:internalin A
MSSQPNLSTNFTTFADWCLHFDSLPEAARHTVEMLLWRATTSDCYEADRILSNLTDLYLSNNRITDISPLSALANLTQLSLNNNQIADISRLFSLANLTQLYLGDNQIADLALVRRQRRNQAIADSSNWLRPNLSIIASY